MFQGKKDDSTRHCETEPVLAEAEENGWENRVDPTTHKHKMIQVQETPKNLHLAQGITDYRHFTKSKEEEEVREKGRRYLLESEQKWFLQ